MKALMRWLFSAALLGGIATGMVFSRSLQGAAPATNPLEGNLPGQMNFLVAGVSDLNGQPASLMSVWLVIIRPTTSELDLLPVYPVHPAMRLPEYEESHPPITFIPKPETLVTLPVIAAQRLHWDAVLLMDESALDSLLELIQFSGQPNATDAWLYRGRPTAAWNDPASTRSQQENLLRFLCEQRAALSDPSGLAMLYNLMPEHIISNLNISQLRGAAQALTATAATWNCRFLLEQENRSDDSK